MPFSRSSTWTASVISLDIRSYLQQIAAVDVGVRDRYDPVVGGVDDESHGARVRRLEQQDLDVGLDVLEAVLYVGLCGRHHVTRSILDEKKVGCEAHLQVRREAADESPSDCSV